MQGPARAMSRFLVVPALLTLLVAGVLVAPAAGTAPTPTVWQEPITGIKAPPVETRRFGEIAEGPYNRLVIQNVNVLPGHGGPSVGIYDILVEGNVITEMRRFDPYMPAEERDTSTASG